MVFMISDQRPGPRVVPAHRRPWRAKLKKVHAALREAEKLSGVAREKALIAVCEMVVAVENDPPVPWRVDAKGMATRINDASTAAYDTAERELESAVSHACGGCMGCFAMDHAPKTTRKTYRVSAAKKGRSRPKRLARARKRPAP
jgi:hypothetical protein